MSFTHIVTFKWKFPDQSAKAAVAADALRAFVANLDGVESYLCGSDIGLSTSSYDFAVVGTFTTQADFEKYRDHPDHQRIIGEQIAPILGDRTVVQLES
jgi:Stress responsive A/B Barrel Domain